MSREARVFAAVLLITITTIEFGGTFLLGILRGGQPPLSGTSPQFPFFRAGHAHAGALTLAAAVLLLGINLFRS